jgi:hypothetical protein
MPFARLRPGRGVKAVRVNDAADVLERAVKHQMRRRVGTGLEIAVDDFAGFQRNHDHVFRLHAGVRHAGRFDDDEAAFAVNAAGVAPGLDDQTFRHQSRLAWQTFFSVLRA